MLIDTNIILEAVLRQDKQRECEHFLDAIDKDLFGEKVYITRFSLNAIEALSRKKHEDFIRDFLLLIVEEKILITPLDIFDDLMINSIRRDLDLDFDDATQFVATNKMGTYLVTYDKDFKKTGLRTKTPNEVLKDVIK